MSNLFDFVDSMMIPNIVWFILLAIVLLFCLLPPKREPRRKTDRERPLDSESVIRSMRGKK